MALLETLHQEGHDYTFQQLRRLLEVVGAGARQSGVLGYPDYRVTQRAAGGANMSVDVAGGEAVGIAALGTRNGLYQQTNDGTVNRAVAANGSGNPRVDQVVLSLFDSDVAGGSDDPLLTVVQGAATAGAQITSPSAAGYRSGAGALSSTAVRNILLADVLVPAGAASILDANIVDRRPWARGEMTFPLDGLVGLSIFSDLDGNVDEEYEVVVVGSLPVTAAINRVNLSLNGDGVAANYASVGHTEGASTGTAYGPSRHGPAAILYPVFIGNVAGVPSRFHARQRIAAKSGGFRLLEGTYSDWENANTYSVGQLGGWWTNTTDAIKRMDITTPLGVFGADSDVTVRKLRRP